MAKIEVVDTFLHGPNRYEEGETRVVSDEEAEYFVGHGWAKYVDGDNSTFDTLPDGETDIQPEDIVQETT